MRRTRFRYCNVSLPLIKAHVTCIQSDLFKLAKWTIVARDKNKILRLYKSQLSPQLEIKPHPGIESMPEQDMEKLNEVQKSYKNDYRAATRISVTRKD